MQENESKTRQLLYLDPVLVLLSFCDTAPIESSLAELKHSGDFAHDLGLAQAEEWQGPADDLKAGDRERKHVAGRAIIWIQMDARPN